MNRRTFIAGVVAGPAVVLAPPNCKRGPTNPKPPPAKVLAADDEGLQRELDDHKVGVSQAHGKVKLGTWPPMGHRCIDLRGGEPDPVMVGFIAPLERLATRT